MNDTTVSAPIGSGPIVLPTRSGSITAEVLKMYLNRGTEMKESIDQMGAEVTQRQDKMRLINDIISEINNLTDEKNGLDLSQQPGLQEKLRVAKELGVNLVEGKLKFNAIERDRLVENLHLAGDSWDKENRSLTQKMEIRIKELDRLMMLLKDVFKYENRPKQAIVAGIKGS